MRAIGYDADFDDARHARRPDRASPRADPGLADGRAVARSAARSGVRPGVELDLGSTGKALAADLAAAAALDAPAPSERGGVLVSLGGDIATAGTAPDGGWRILVAEDSETPGRRGRARSSRSTAARSRRRARPSAAGGAASRTLHHLVDPADGRPGRLAVADRHGRRRRPASTPTPRRPRRSSAAPRPRLARGAGLPARLVAADGTSSGSAAGRSRRGRRAPTRRLRVTGSKGPARMIGCAT